jgi:predicted enzyme related to lactoylglutathione lyase
VTEQPKEEPCPTRSCASRSAARTARPWPTFYVQVDDPQAALDDAEKLGGKVVMPVTTIPNMVTLALFTDPEAHMVGVVASEVPTG